MVQFLKLNSLSPDRLNTLMRRAEKDIRDLFPLAQEVIDRVRAEGDAAVVDYTRKFDAPRFQRFDAARDAGDFAAARQALERGRDRRN